MAFELIQSAPAEQAIITAEKRDKVKFKKIVKALGLLAEDPRSPSLQSHVFEHVFGPSGEPIWESYIENNAPAAWRIWWHYGPGTGQLTITAIGPHA